MTINGQITADDIIVEYTLECSQCGKPESAVGATNALEAAGDFNSDGWKVIDGEPTCPDCQDEE